MVAGLYRPGDPELRRLRAARAGRRTPERHGLLLRVPRATCADADRGTHAEAHPDADRSTDTEAYADADCGADAEAHADAYGGADAEAQA